MFDANKGITLDGVGYDVRIMARNIDTLIRINNPNTEKWKQWEKMIFTMGGELAERSGNKDMIELFAR